MAPLEKLAGDRQLHRNSHPFTGDAALCAPASPPKQYRVLIDGPSASPWPLPLALNLALAILETEFAVSLTVPAALTAAAARLLGAGPRGLGDPLSSRAEPVALLPYPGLNLVTRSSVAPRREAPCPAWCLELFPPPQRRGIRIVLEEGTGGAGEGEGEGDEDRRGSAAETRFLLRLEGSGGPGDPAAEDWGQLPANFLLDPDRPHLSVWLSGHEGARRRLRGYRETLRILAADSGAGMLGAGS